MQVDEATGTTVVGDLVFTGGLDGVVHALNVQDGSEAWKWQASAGLNAPLAAVGDYLCVGAGGPLLPSADAASPAPTAATALVAIRLGAARSPTPAT